MRRMRGTSVGLLAAIVLALLGAAFPAVAQGQGPSDPAVARARQLVGEKDAKAAFDLLAPMEARSAGNVEFDYWLGVAALESGRLERAVVALDRVLLRDPDFDSARLELGRAYLRLGSLDLAAQEFTRLLGRAPTEAGAALLRDYLAEIRRLKDRARYALAAYVELGGGRDTNLSSSTRDFSGAILGSFGLPGIEPTGNSVRRQDNFLTANAGAEGTYRLREDRVLFAAADLRWRGYREFGDYDYLLGEASLGYQARVGELTYTATGFLQSFRQDGAPVDTLDGERTANDRHSFGAGFEVRRAIRADLQLVAGVQLAAFGYPANPGQDTRQLTLSLALEARPAWWPGASVAARAFYGYDEARRPLNAFTEASASRHTQGVRLVAQTDPRASLGWQAVLGWSRRIDDDPYARATQVATGRDDLLEVAVRATWRLDEAWSIVPYALLVHNKSNIALYAFRKAEGGVMLRRDFR